MVGCQQQWPGVSWWVASDFDDSRYQSKAAYAMLSNKCGSITEQATDMDR